MAICYQNRGVKLEKCNFCRRLNEEHESVVVPSGHKIHSLAISSFEAVQISQASPAWQDFIDYIDAIVLDGLKQATLTSLKMMLNNLVQANMAEVNNMFKMVIMFTGRINGNISNFCCAQFLSTASKP